MLHFFVTKRGGHTLKDYLGDWVGNLRGFMAVHFYEDYEWPVAGPGNYVFTDLERLSEGQLQLAVEYAGRLRDSGVELRILNSPEKALRRLDLLREMSRCGINRFRAFRLRDLPESFRFPGFLRMGRDHKGAASPLLENRDELLSASNKILAGGADVEDILAVEFCDTLSPDGFYRKYSYFRIADAIIPAHIIFSKNWVAKDGALNAEQVAEEDRFHSECPHAEWARNIFEKAGIDYGRIDFSLCPDGAPQVWEINTNPVLLSARAKYRKQTPLEMPRKELLALQLADAWKSLLPKHAGFPPAADPASASLWGNELFLTVRNFFRMRKGS